MNDQARIQNFNGSDTKYLWSLVVAKGDDYIDISRVDKDGDGIPAEGDEIVQLGNRTNTNRQDAVLLSAVNGEVGIFMGRPSSAIRRRSTSIFPARRGAGSASTGTRKELL